jgi:hypothetical protein
MLCYVWRMLGALFFGTVFQSHALTLFLHRRILLLNRL